MRLLKDTVGMSVLQKEVQVTVYSNEIPSGMDPWDYVAFVKEMGGTLPYEEYNSDEDW